MLFARVPLCILGHLFNLFLPNFDSVYSKLINLSESEFKFSSSGFVFLPNFERKTLPMLSDIIMHL